MGVVLPGEVVEEDVIQRYLDFKKAFDSIECRLYGGCEQLLAGEVVEEDVIQRSYSQQFF